MFFKCSFSIIFFLFFILSNIESIAMIGNEADEYPKKHLVRKRVNYSKNKIFSLKFSDFSFNFAEIPRELTKEILYFLEFQDVLHLRETAQGVKNIVDTDYWKSHFINIRTKSSFPVIQAIENIPASSIFLSFNEWKQQDIERVIFFKHVVTLYLAGLQSWDFSTGELFNPSLCSYSTSVIISMLNFAAVNIIGIEICSPTIFTSVTSLDLSNSRIGDYGIISFVANFKKLKSLDLSGNDIGYNIIGEVNAIANISTITSLNISKNHFSNLTVKEIERLTNLTSLDIAYNCISDNIRVKKLKELPKLINLFHKGQKEKHNYEYDF